MISRYQVVNNGGLVCKEYFYTCDKCGKEMFEGWPRYDKDGDYCVSCAYLLDKIDTDTYKRLTPCMPYQWNAGKHEGKIYWWFTKKAPWDLPDKDYRGTNAYKEWRTSVFTRDNFTCQKCQQVGGKLEAHHIEKFHKHIELRYETTNGLTLCRPCHMKEHRKVCNG